MSTLLLQRNQELKLGLRFFEHMENLQVLDLYKTEITALPSSVSSLVKLVSLYLNDCFCLEDLSHVKMCKSLEVLDIRGTSINVLPDEIGGMCNLRCLRFSFGRKACYKISVGKQAAKLTIRPNVIGSLKQLEELSIEMGCCNQDWSTIADKIADELASLENLTTLFIHFPSVCSLQRFVTRSISWKNVETNWERNTFRSFNFSIGCSGRQHAYGSNVSGILAERQLRFSAKEEIEEEISLADGQETSSVNDVLRQASAFELVDHSLVESLSEYDLINAGSLKVCIVGHCRNLRWIVDAPKMSKSAAGAILRCLEMLHLFELGLLESIWKGSVFPESLTRLRVLTLTGCPKLTEILNLELAKVLSSLEHLKVENCFKVREIIKVQPSHHPVDADLSNSLPKLETIELVNLPNLQSVCSCTSKQWKSLRKIVVSNCRELRQLLLSAMEKVERIQCERSWWTALHESEEVKKQFVDHCDFIEAYHEGGIYVGPHQDSENNDSKIYNGRTGVEDVKPRNGNSSGLPTSNIHAQGECAAEECRVRKGKMKVNEIHVDGF